MRFSTATLILTATATLWAAELQVAGVRNFAEVDEHIYRGGQPTEQGFEGLAKLGIKTVVDLRAGRDHDSREKIRVEALGMKYIHIPLSALQAPSEAQMNQALALLEPAASEGWPVFIHCMRGKDRTGTVIAAYRISHDGWRNQKALEEAREHGLSRMEFAMWQYILHYTPPNKTSAATKLP